MRKRHALLPLLALPAAALGARWATARPRPGAAYLAGAPLLMAHRGGADLAPENTLLALRRSVEWWSADVLEIDVQPTRDGEVVVFHDATLERTTDGAGPIAEHTLAEVQRLDAGYRFSPDAGQSFPFRGREVRVSTLGEVLDALPGVRINVEIKDARAQEAVWRTIHERGAAGRVLIAAALRANRARFDGYAGAVSASAEELKGFYAHHMLRAGALYHAPVDAFQMPERHRGVQVISRRFIRVAHASNVAVHVWTIDAAHDMRRLLEWGADGIVTNRPDRLARVLHRVANRPLPPGPPAGEAEPFLERLLRAG